MIGYVREGIREALGQLRSAVDSLLAAADVDSLSDAELTDVLREFETETRRTATVDHRLIAEVDRRGIAHDHGCRDTKTFLAQLLRLSRTEASRA